MAEAKKAKAKKQEEVTAEVTEAKKENYYQICSKTN